MPRGGARRNRVWRSLAPTPPLARIFLDASGFGDFSATEGASSFDPGVGFIVRSANAGLLDQVTAGVVYLTGSGWLSISVVKQPDRSWAGSCVVDVTGLAVGVHRAVVRVSDPNAENPGQEIPITLTVTTADTTLRVTPATRALTTTEGTLGSATTFTIDNASSGTMAVPTVGAIEYGAGASGWIASVSIAGAAGGPWTATVQSTGVGVAPGSYTCTIPFGASNASNSPQAVTCSIVVSVAQPPPSLMQLSQPSVSLLGVASSGLSPVATVTVSGQQGATLGTTGVGVITGSGAAALSASVLGRVVTVTANPDAVAPGDYTATIPVTDTLATNSPQPLSVSLTVQPASTPSTTDIDGQLVLVGGTAGVSARYAMSWPLRPGDMTAADVTARKGALFVGGVELPVTVRATRGAHSDGSLRSVLVEYDYNFPNTTAIPCQFRLGVTRGTTDLTPTTITAATVWNQSVTPYQVRALLVPTDPTYLCETQVAGSPLVPMAQLDAVSAPLFSAYMDNRYEALKNLENTNTTAQSDYEHVRGLVAAWCMSGNTKYLVQALSRARYLWTYTCDTTPSVFNPTHNLEAIPGGSGLLGAEPKTQRHWTWFVGYYLTGWPSFYATANAGGQQAMRSAVATTYARQSSNPIYLSPRFNCRLVPYVGISALMDATRTMSSPSGAGVSGATMATELADVITETFADRYVETHGGTGWRTGFPWVNAGVDVRGSDASAQVGDWPWFQSALSARHLVDYYLMVHANSAIPPVLKLMVDAMVAQCKVSSGGAYSKGSDVTSANLGGTVYTFDEPMYGVPYLTRADPASNGGMYAWLQPMWAPAVAFVAKYYGGNDPALGVSYDTWYRRMVNPRLVYHTGSNSSGLTWSWKIWGEVFGGNFVAVYLMSLSGAPQGPASIRTPTVYTSWPT